MIKERRTHNGAGLVLLGAVLSLVLVQGADAAASPGAAEGIPRFGHVFVLIGENTDLSQINSVNAPYLMDVLRPEWEAPSSGRPPDFLFFPGVEVQRFNGPQGRERRRG